MGPAPVAAVALAILLAGCMGNDAFPHEQWPIVDVIEAEHVLMLEYTLTNLDDTFRRAEPGRHCPAVYHEGGHLEVQEWAMERAVDAAGAGGAFLYVDPWLKGNWTGDHGAVFTGLPAAVSARIDVPFDDPEAGEAWTHIDVQGDAAMVDAEPVELPHHWTVTADDGSWRIDARLTPGPKTIGIIEDQECD